MNKKFDAEVELVESHSGAYEITVDGNLLYSKKETGEFPNEEQLLNELETG